MTIKEMRDARKRAHEQAVVYLAKQPFDSEARSSYQKAMTEVDRLGLEIRKAEGKSTGSIITSDVPDQDHKRAEIFNRWIRRGSLSESEMRSLEFRDVAEGAPMLNHIGTYTGLGYFVPTGFANAIEQATKYFAPLADGSAFKLWETKTGNPIPFPTSNDTSAIATIVGEAGTTTEQDVTANQINFGSYKFSSGVIKASIELLQDSAFDIESWLAERFGERFGRALELYLTSGTGSGQPTGILTAIAASGVTPIVAAGSSANDGSSNNGTNSIGYADLVNLEHSVDPTYRRGAKYMFHDQTLSFLKRLLDKYGRPLWAPGITAGDPDKINGYSYVINQQMPQIGAAANTVVFGDLSKFVVRKVLGFEVQRLSELYAITGQVGFLAFMRYDSNLLDAGTHPVNYLQQHS